MQIVEVYLMEFIQMGLQFLLFLLGQEECEDGSDFAKFLLKGGPFLCELA